MCYLSAAGGEQHHLRFASASFFSGILFELEQLYA